jgi:hypothetical protein
MERRHAYRNSRRLKDPRAASGGGEPAKEPVTRAFDRGERLVSETVPPCASNATVTILGRITIVIVVESPLNVAFNTTVRETVVCFAVSTPPESVA